MVGLWMFMVDISISIIEGVMDQQKHSWGHQIVDQFYVLMGNSWGDCHYSAVFFWGCAVFCDS